ncbi:MAG: hypothetical protein IJC84_05620 [Clostridia bacterium]|nr:hypothetical protein [Clostridia bacterium]
MKEDMIFLMLDLAFPAVLYVLGSATDRNVGRILKREAVFCICLALLFALPMFLYASLEVQGAVCAMLLFFTYLCPWLAMRKENKKDPS